MKRFAVMLSVAALAGACSYSHIATTNATFAGGTPLVLKITRHLDTVVHGPDDEEDQLLTLEVRNFHLNKRLAVPSANVTPTFEVTRFGPSSKGETFRGYLIVRKVAANRVEATMSIDVNARTESGAYKQTAKFHGTFVFVEGSATVP